MVFLFILTILILLIITLKIKIEIININLTIKEPALKKNNNNRVFNMQDNYSIIILFKTLGFLPFIKINFTKQKIDKLSKKINFEKINSRFKNYRKNSSLTDIKKIIQNLKIEVKKFYLKAGIGLDSIIVLTYIIPIICTFLSIYLANKKIKTQNQYYQIKPVYNSRKFSKCSI